MGRYDEIDPDELRRHLVRVAKLILQLDEDGELLRAAPRLQKLFGDLRQKLFAYEVRSTANLGPDDESAGEDETVGEESVDSLLDESLRVVREAIERQEELREELDSGRPTDDDDGEDEG